MNPLACLSFFTFSFYLFVGLYVISQDRYSRLNLSIFWLCLVLGWWALFYSFVYYQNIWPSVWFWYKLASFGWLFAPPAVVHFTMTFARRYEWLDRKRNLVLLYLPAFFFFICSVIFHFDVSGFLYENGVVYEMVNKKSPLYWLYNIYYFVCLFLGFVFVYLWGRKSTLSFEKKQARIILVGGSAAFLLMVLSNVVMPLLKLKLLPSIAPSFLMIWVVTIWYAMNRYKLLSLSAEVAADEILANIVDVVFLTDRDGRITRANRSAQIILGYQPWDLVGKRLESVLIPDDHKLGSEDGSEVSSLHTTRITWEMECLTKTGERLPFTLYTSPVHNPAGQHVGNIVVGKDLRMIKRLEEEIWTRRQAEAELAKNNEQLESKVRERTRELEIYATMDSLSGVYNRRSGLLLLEKEMKRSRREKTPLSVVFVDINDLKKTNDHKGHHIGDFLIQTVADILRETIRESDVVCRMGGDEFLMVLNRCDTEQAGHIVEEIRVKMADATLNNPEGISIQACFGVAEFDPASDQTEDGLIILADERMLEEKRITRAGR